MSKIGADSLPYLIQFCSLSSPRPAEVQVRKHECQLCSKAFLKIQHLQDHLNTHLGVKLHQCQLCVKKYSSAASLKSHLINVHQQGKLCVCVVYNGSCQTGLFTMFKRDWKMAIEPYSYRSDFETIRKWH